MKSSANRFARWREARRARAQRRLEARMHRATSSHNMDRLRAEGRMADDDRRRAFFSGGGFGL